MFIIAHRGNIDGPFPSMENNPSYVNNALEKGYNVEVDVWWTEEGLFLGHDKPQYAISEKFLEDSRIWCHMKNLEALELISRNKKIHYFWHENDQITLTSENFIWTYPGVELLTSKSIAVMPENHQNQSLYDLNGWLIRKCAGVCTDYSATFREILL